MKFDSRFFCCMLCSFVLAAGSITSVYADLPEVVGDDVEDVIDLPVVEEIPGDPAALLDNIPMPMSVVTPIEEFERLPTAFLWSSAVGGYAYGNSVSGDVDSAIYFFANASAVPRSGVVEFIVELTLPGGIDHDKIFLNASNKLTGFTLGKFFNASYGSFNSIAIDTFSGINYVDDTTVRVSFTATNFNGCMLRLDLKDNYVNGGTVNIYARPVVMVSEIGGDGGGGSEGGGGGAAT